MDRLHLAIIAGAFVAAGAIIATAQQADTTTDPGATDAPVGDSSIVDEIMASTRSMLGLWRPPEKYAATIAAAEVRCGLPTDLLARLLYQECRWRDDIISGRVKSPVGAVGIAQFMPATAAEWGVNPLDPESSINGAARYLARLYGQFGNWSEALAAYNWGMGNVSRRGLSAAPAETRTYYSSILADVNAANGTTWA